MESRQARLRLFDLRSQLGVAVLPQLDEPRVVSDGLFLVAPPLFDLSEPPHARRNPFVAAEALIREKPTCGIIVPAKQEQQLSACIPDGWPWAEPPRLERQRDLSADALQPGKCVLQPSGFRRHGRADCM